MLMVSSQAFGITIVEYPSQYASDTPKLISVKNSPADPSQWMITIEACHKIFEVTGDPEELKSEELQDSMLTAINVSCGYQ